MIRIVSTLIVVLLAGCNRVRPESPPLTAEEAKTALLELIYTGDLENLQTFPIAKYQALPLKLSDDGLTHFWGKYEIHLEHQIYEFAETRFENDQRIRTMWRGRFVYHHQQWKATIPKLLMTTN